MEASLPSVAFFMHDLSGGGVERMRLRLAGELAVRGHVVTLIVQLARGELRTQIPQGVDLLELGQLHTWKSVIPLAATLKRLRPSFLVSSLDHNNIAALCARALSGNATRVIICQHNTISAESVRGWRYRIVPLLYWYASRWADAIVAVSAGVADDLVATTGLARRRITVIHNPVVSNTKQVPTPAAPHPWLADRSVPVFLYAGRLEAQKDPAFLLRAFARRLRHGAARLILLGDGPLRQSLLREAACLGITEHVHFAGFVADPLPWMEHAAALVLPSRYEGFGNVLVEAMSQGTPVIATDCPHGPGEILAGGRFGWLVRIGDESGLAAAMQDDSRASFAPARLRLRAQAFSVAACAARHQALFARILRSRQRYVFGLRLSGLDAASVGARLMQPVPGPGPRMVVTPNLDHIRLMRALPEFAAACQAAEIVCADGFSVALYARLQGAGDGRRATGCDIFHALAAGAAANRRRVLVIAENQETACAVHDWANRCGCGELWRAVAAPPALISDDQSQRNLVRTVVDAQPHILVMALGAPASEIFVHRYRAALPACWALCCGQAVRVELGLTRRAPLLVRRLTLEWAWRLLQEPQRLSLRYARDALAVPAMILADMRRGKTRRRTVPSSFDSVGDQPGI